MSVQNPPKPTLATLLYELEQARVELERQTAAFEKQAPSPDARGLNLIWSYPNAKQNFERSRAAVIERIAKLARVPATIVAISLWGTA